jgi:hypothetical protein
MANSQSSGNNYEYASVDTHPGATGYYTKEIDVRHLKQLGARVFFSIREAIAEQSEAPSAASTITVILQFKCPGDPDWTDFDSLDGSTFVIGNRVEINDNGMGLLWRAGVRSDEYTSGSVRFGFDW